MPDLPQFFSGKKILIMAGGTGGHVFPGLAVAKELAGRGCTIEWLGTSSGIENTLVPAAGYTLFISNISGVRGKGVLTLFFAPLRIYRAVREALKTLKKIEPDMVIGMGGFVAGPGGIAARIHNIPLVLHEQNAIAGTTNRLLSLFAAKKLCGFPNVLRGSEFVGNPVRLEIENLPAPEQRFSDRDETLRVLILGGSRGARALNAMVPQAIHKSSFRHKCNIWHQCGGDWAKETSGEYASLGIEAKVEPFIDDVATALGWADLVICRSGALTVAELAAAGVGSILVPYPYAIDDHQTANARYLSDAGAAVLKQQSELSPEIMAVLLNELLADREMLLDMAISARKAACIGVAKKFADYCEVLLTRSANAKRST